MFSWLSCCLTADRRLLEDPAVQNSAEQIQKLGNARPQTEASAISRGGLEVPWCHITMSHPPGKLSSGAQRKTCSRGSQCSGGDLFPTRPIFGANPRSAALPNSCTLYPHSVFVLCLDRWLFSQIILVLRSLPSLHPIIMLQQQLQKYSPDTTDNKG